MRIDKPLSVEVAADEMKLNDPLEWQCIQITPPVIPEILRVNIQICYVQQHTAIGFFKYFTDERCLSHFGRRELYIVRNILKDQRHRYPLFDLFDIADKDPKRLRSIRNRCQVADLNSIRPC